MIDLYYWTTPNGHKITLFLEEAGLPYTIHPVDLGRGDQFKPEFLAISPNNRIPAIVDQDPGDGGAPLSVFESGAILLYLAEKTSKFLPKDLRGRIAALEWLFWQVGGLGPMAGQNHHFKQYAREKLTYAIDRYVNETNRYAVLNKRLADHAFVAGDYSLVTKARSLKIFRILSAGSRRSVPVPRHSAPMPRRRKSIKRRSPPTRSRAKSCSRRRRRM
jgi:GST-like protein